MVVGGSEGDIYSGESGDHQQAGCAWVFEDILLWRHDDQITGPLWGESIGHRWTHKGPGNERPWTVTSHGGE